MSGDWISCDTFEMNSWRIASIWSSSIAIVLTLFTSVSKTPLSPATLSSRTLKSPFAMRSIASMIGPKKPIWACMRREPKNAPMLSKTRKVKTDPSTALITWASSAEGWYPARSYTSAVRKNATATMAARNRLTRTATATLPRSARRLIGAPPGGSPGRARFGS